MFRLAPLRILRTPWCPLAVVAVLLVQTVSAYTPMLPKTGPTEKVIVVDITKDKLVGTDAYNIYYHFSESQDAVMAICALQGLINRDSPTKIYLTNVPGQISWSPEVMLFRPEDDPSTTALEDGLIPYPIEYAELDETKRFPALSWLLDNYGHLVKGKALCPTTAGHEHDVTETSGARAAALNACTFESFLPVTPLINKYLLHEGYRIEQKYDLRSMDNVEAMRWSMDQYLDHPKLNRQLVSAWSEVGTHPSTMADYFVATYTFNYFYNRHHGFHEQFGSKLEEEAGDPLLRELLSGEHFYKGAPHFGCVEMSHLIPLIQELGYTCVCGHFPNASMTSSIPTRPDSFTPADEPRVLPIDPNGIYLAWNGPDGDNINFAFTFNYPAMRNDPLTGDVPVGWRFNPYIMDLFPTLFAWYTEQGPDTIDLVTSPNDGGDPQGAEGRAYWKKTYLNYVSNSNGAVHVANFMGQFPNDHFHDIMGDDGPFDLVINGYHGLNDYEEKWLIRDNAYDTVYVNQIGFRGPKPSRPGHFLVDNTYNHLLGVFENRIREGEPYFVMGRLPSEAGINGFTIIRYLTERLQRAVPRTIYLVRPSDLAATYRYWSQQAPMASFADRTVVELQADLLDEDPQVRTFAAWELVNRNVGRPVEDNFLAALYDVDPRVRQGAIAGLRAIGANAKSHSLPEKFLRVLQKDVDPIVQGMAAAALADLKDERAIPVLIDKLGTESGLQAAHALVRFGPDALPALMAALDATHRDSVRGDLAEAFAALGAQAAPAAQVLTAALERADDRLTQQALLRALSRIGPSAQIALPELIRLSRIDVDLVANASIALMAKFAPGNETVVVPALIDALDRERSKSIRGMDPEFGRLAAIRALEAVGAPAKAALPRLRELQTHPKAKFSKAATQAVTAISPQ